jgi:ribosome-binding protein aMBF1 (putative translation factor)
MIQNEHQYKVSKAALNKFLLALEQYQPSAGLHPKLAAAQRQAFQGQIDTLKAELEAYEHLKAQEPSINTAPLEQIADDLIRARIASGYTQAQLAAKLKMKPQQIQRYEASKYASASLARVLEVARVLQNAKR